MFYLYVIENCYYIVVERRFTLVGGEVLAGGNFSVFTPSKMKVAKHFLYIFYSQNSQAA